MLCDACQSIFSTPRKLTYGSYDDWPQTPTSFQLTLLSNCRLCHVIKASLESSRTAIAKGFPNRLQYAFKALNPLWARDGKGPKWFVPRTSGYGEGVGGILGRNEVSEYLVQVEKDPTPNGLGSLLAEDSDELANELANAWLILEFYGRGCHLILPMEPDFEEDLEVLAQKNLKAQTSSGSEETLQLGKAWLDNCLQYHACGPHKSDLWLPSRLIEVGSSKMHQCRLVLGSTLDLATSYIALSYRWSEDTTFTLTQKNFVTYQERIDTTKLPNTIQDAIKITRALGSQYLWVDSLCIVQDSEHDWQQELVTMSQVYGLATCTIAAANSGSGEGGCFSKRSPYGVRPCRIPNPFAPGSKLSFYVRHEYLNRIHAAKVKESIWYNRGWVFQERTLSPRMIIFSKEQMLWTCGELQAAETWPCGKSNKNHIDRFESMAIEKDRFRKLLDPKEGVMKSQLAWLAFIRDYTTSRLTLESDRLAALQGVASLIESLTGQDYCGGLWLNEGLPVALLWRGPVRPLPHLTRSSTPSWSWASAPGEVIFLPPLYNHETLVQVVGKARVRMVSGSFTIDETCEALLIHGVLLSAKLMIARNGQWGILRTRTMAENWTKLRRMQKGGTLDMAKGSGTESPRASSYASSFSENSTLKSKSGFKKALSRVTKKISSKSSPKNHRNCGLRSRSGRSKRRLYFLAARGRRRSHT